MINTLIDALSYSMLLFIFAGGFTLVFGVMNIVNIAHGSLYLLGAYFAFSLMKWTDSFWLALVCSSCAVSVLGMLIYRLILYRVFENHMLQILSTFGILMIISETTVWTWGGSPLMVPTPNFLRGMWEIGGVLVSNYRLALIVLGLLFGLFLWVVLEKTMWGAMLKAGAEDREMASGVGIKVPILFTLLFGLGSFMAAFAGVLGGAFTGASPGMEWEVLLPCFIVVVVGGIGSVKGAFLASLLFGFADTFGKVAFPNFAMFTMYLLMALVLTLRPQGIFGKV